MLAKKTGVCRASGSGEKPVFTGWDAVHNSILAIACLFGLIAELKKARPVGAGLCSAESAMRPA